MDLGDGFFRPDSRASRDFSVLFAVMQLQRVGRGCSTFRWLDLTAGCGIRALRWGLEAAGGQLEKNNDLKGLEIWVNDGDEFRMDPLKRNLELIKQLGISTRVINSPADALLYRAFLDKTHFDLIDLDCFGCSNSLLQPLLKVLAFEGVLVLSSTDGRSPTGHDRLAAIRNFGASARTHPASWEVAIRLHLALIAREAWMLGRGLEPLGCFSDGRTFRFFVRIKRLICSAEEQQIGLLARCEACGAQSTQTLLNLKAWPECACDRGRWIISGPLWLGPLQTPVVLTDLLQLSKKLAIPISKKSLRLLQKLSADEGLPVFCWSTAELSRRLSLQEMPTVSALVKALQLDGYQASPSGVMPGQIRTDASIAELLSICRGISL